MNKSLCHREEEVVAAVISGVMAGPIAEHISTCESCRAAADLTRLFQDEKAGAIEETIDTRAADLIWMKAALEMGEKRKRKRRLGLTVGAVSGVLMTGLTALVISPPDVARSLEQIESLPALSLPLMAPLVLILLAVSLVVLADRANGSISRTY